MGPANSQSFCVGSPKYTARELAVHEWNIWLFTPPPPPPPVLYLLRIWGRRDVILTWHDTAHKRTVQSAWFVQLFLLFLFFCFFIYLFWRMNLIRLRMLDIKEQWHTSWLQHELFLFFFFFLFNKIEFACTYYIYIYI